MTDHCILIHYHEISIKGGNRNWFEKIFIRNVKKQLSPLPFSRVVLNGARVFIYGIHVDLWNEYSKRLKCVLGLKNATIMTEVSGKDLQNIKDAAVKLIDGREFDNFRVSAKRQFKNYPYSSMDINREVGATIFNEFKKPVKLKGADLDLIIEIVKNTAFLGVDKIVGYGGLPVGVGETAVSLLSSGIDSPVSSFEMLKRGVSLTYVHFHSVPSTSRQSIKNVEEILQQISNFQHKCVVYMVPLLTIQQKIMKGSPNKLWVILFRRALIRLGEIIADNIGAQALISGENIGQVASQTLSNIRATSDAVDIPIIRPLAGYNKEDIINRAKEIDTYELSIEPYQDCCSFFVPKHPETKANLEEVRTVESKIDLQPLYDEALLNTEIKTIVFDPKKVFSKKTLQLIHSKTEK